MTLTDVLQALSAASAAFAAIVALYISRKSERPRLNVRFEFDVISYRGADLNAAMKEIDAATKKISFFIENFGFMPTTVSFVSWSFGRGRKRKMHS